MKYDKGSFITVPTSSILGIGVGPQALYMWLCSYANKDGECFPSRGTLANDIGCSERALDGYLEELISLGLVVKEQRFSNNKQVSNNYYLPLGVAKYARGVAESAPTPSQNLRTELNPVLTQSTEPVANAKGLTIEKDLDSDKPTRTSGGKKVTSEMKQVFELFDDNPARKAWHLREIERTSAQILFSDFGLDELQKRYSAVKAHRGEEMCPVISSPSQLLEKMPSMENFMKNL